MTSTTTFLHLLWEYLASRTTEPSARLCLVRTAARRPVTGNPVTGWAA